MRLRNVGTDWVSPTPAGEASKQGGVGLRLTQGLSCSLLTMQLQLPQEASGLLFNVRSITGLKFLFGLRRVSEGDSPNNVR